MSASGASATLTGSSVSVLAAAASSVTLPSLVAGVAIGVGSAAGTSALGGHVLGTEQITSFCSTPLTLPIPMHSTRVPSSVSRQIAGRDVKRS